MSQSPQVISAKEYIARTHQAFDNYCKKVTAEAQAKIAKLDEGDEESRTRIIEEQNEVLEKTLAEFNKVVKDKMSETIRILEQEDAISEDEDFNLDDELTGV
ncbi:hypothetical protein JW758_03875 [Candidatus Peregrinibacteria bacterium]|nr:hypothetical protein [Candidatus Peregrinibacteria bacterium]